MAALARSVLRYSARHEAAASDSFADHVINGLTDNPKWLSAKYFYDAAGSDLFEEITRLPEYYPTRTELKILASNARATEIPGVDLAALTPEQRTTALNRLNDEKCDCGCGLTIAQCRINDSTCAVSPKLAAVIVAEVTAGK